ncbi:ABC transporter permease, partial [bacterium]|nr:ABC transporter permease [bacterium]
MNLKSMKTIWSLLGPFLGLILVFVIFTIAAPPAFYGIYNIKTIITQTVIIGVGALGMTLVIISSGIDLSVGSVIALTTVGIANVLNSGGGPWMPVLAVFAALLIGFLCGMVNGILSASLRIVPFIVTLGTMQIARG